MNHNPLCRFANDNREFKKSVCFDCQRLDKARKAALIEVRDLLYKDRDIYFNAYILLGELFKKEGINDSKSD